VRIALKSVSPVETTTPQAVDGNQAGLSFLSSLRIAHNEALRDGGSSGAHSQANAQTSDSGTQDEQSGTLQAASPSAKSLGGSEPLSAAQNAESQKQIGSTTENLLTLKTAVSSLQTGARRAVSARPILVRPNSSSSDTSTTILAAPAQVASQTVSKTQQLQSTSTHADSLLQLSSTLDQISNRALNALQQFTESWSGTVAQVSPSTPTTGKSANASTLAAVSYPSDPASPAQELTLASHSSSGSQSLLESTPLAASTLGSAGPIADQAADEAKQSSQSGHPEASTSGQPASLTPQSSSTLDPTLLPQIGFQQQASSSQTPQSQQDSLLQDQTPLSQQISGLQPLTFPMPAGASTTINSSSIGSQKTEGAKRADQSGAQPASAADQSAPSQAANTAQLSSSIRSSESLLQHLAKSLPSGALNPGTAPNAARGATTAPTKLASDSTSAGVPAGGSQSSLSDSSHPQSLASTLNVQVASVANERPGEANQSKSGASTLSASSISGITKGKASTSATAPVSDAQSTNTQSTSSQSGSAQTDGQPTPHSETVAATPLAGAERPSESALAQVSAMPTVSSSHESTASRSNAPATGDSPQTADHAAVSQSGSAEGENVPAATGINAARLIQTMGQTEMRVGMHSSEFGDISVRTYVSQQQMSAQISVDHGALSAAISARIPSMQEKFGNDHGVHASVQVNQGSASFSEGREQASQRDQKSAFYQAPLAQAVQESDVERSALRSPPSTADSYRLDIRA